MLAAKCNFFVQIYKHFAVNAFRGGEMDLQEKLALVKSNTVEIVTEEELEELLSKSRKPTAYCGYEPSGEIHLGHLVTVSKLIDLENAGFNVKVLLADWHAFLNRKGSWEFIHRTAKNWESAFKKLGLKKTECVLGSRFQRSSDYIDDVLTLSLNTTIKRGMRSMQEVARDLEHAHISQVIYPLMQIADIKHLNVDVAQSGIEQRKIHMISREILETVKYKKPVLVHTPLINSLQGEGKMSSSASESLISVRDSEEDIRSKLNKAYCPEARVEDNPVIEIARLIIFPRVERFEIERPQRFGGSISFDSIGELEKKYVARQLHPMDLKKGIAEELIRILSPVRLAFKDQPASINLESA